MTRPRKEQIESVNTKYGRSIILSVSPNVLSSAFAPGTLNPALITDLPGGSEVDVPPVVTSPSAGPYPILAGDAVNVRLNAGPSFLVTFTATDTTASRIAARINAAVGSPIASNSNGRLRIVGTLAGATGSIQLSDALPGSLAKLGLSAGTTTGQEGPVRGVLTRTLDLMGGLVLLKTADGRALVTDGSESRPYRVSGGAVLSTISVPGGCPVQGRITYDGTNYQVGYNVLLPSRGAVVTFNSRFDLLDNTDSFNVDLGYGGSFAVTFPSPPYTRDQVLARINDAYRTSAGFSPVGAELYTTVTQPYSLNGHSLFFQIDGGATQSVTFDPTHVTAALVAARIQASVTGVTCAAVTTPYGTQVRIRSNNTNAVTSSVRIWLGSTATGLALGVAPGLYRAPYVAVPYGPDEIRIVHPERGASHAVTISGSGTTIGRMGLVAGAFSGTSSPVLEPAATPFRNDPTGATPYSVVAMIPEVLEFGDIDAGGDQVLQGVLSSTESQSYDVTLAAARTTASDGRPIDTVSSFGVQDYGKPVVVASGGYVDPSLLLPAIAYTQNLVKQFYRGDFAPGAATALVTKEIEGPGTNGNPGAKSNTLRVEVDPDATFATSTFTVGVDRDVAGKDLLVASRFPLAGGILALIGTDNDQTAIGSFASELKIQDLNIYDETLPHVGANRYLRLTSENEPGARHIRIGEVATYSNRTNVEDHSIVQKLNSIWTIVCGDGSNSFGDFSGTNAIHMAIQFISSYVGAGTMFRIRLKRGNYTVNAANGVITVPSGITLVIEGEQSSTTTITVTDGTANVMFVDTGSLVILRDLRLQKGIPGAGVRVDCTAGSAIDARDCAFSNVIFSFLDPAFYRFYRCTFLNAASGNTDGPLLLRLGDGAVHVGPFLAEDCDIRTGDNCPVMRIQAFSGAVPLTHVDNILFNRCRIQLRSTTTTSGRLTGNCGVLDLDPNGTDARSPTFTGVNVRHVKWKDCVVTANVGSGANNILAHIMPRANGTVGGSTWTNVVRLTIEGGVWTCPSLSSTFAPFVICGVGGANLNDAVGTYGPDRGGVYIRGLVFGYAGTSSVSYGAATSEMPDYFSNGGAIAADTWAAFAIQSFITEIRDMRFVNPSQLSTAGDVLLMREILDVDGIRFENYKTGGGGSAPHGRFRLRPGVFANATGCYARVRNVCMTGVTTGAGDWALDGIMIVEPWFNGSDDDGGWTTIESCTISGFRTGAGLSSVSGIYYFSNASDVYFPSNPKDAKNFTIRDCEIADVAEGIQIAVGQSGVSLFNLRVLDNQINDCGIGFQVAITVGATSNSILFSRNRIVGCSVNPAALFFISGVSNGGVNEAAFVQVVDNVVAENGTASGPQIQIYPATGAGEENNYIRGVCRGNVCKMGASQGSIQVRRTDGAGVAQALPATANHNNLVGAVALRGIETGHSLATSDVYEYTNNNVMDHNFATLVTP